MNTSTVIDDTTPLTKEIYVISSSTTGGTGTKTDPHKAQNGNIDFLIAVFGDSCSVHLAAGNYVTRGFKAPKSFILQGEGKNNTVLKLMDNVRTANFNYPHIKMISDNDWSILFVVKNITLDGNWKGQSEAETSGNFKIDPIVVKTIRGKVENVRITNFGCNGKAYGSLGLECFPLSLFTFSNGDPFKYDPGFLSLIGKEDQTYLEISECEVLNPNFFFGGYATAIFVNTNFVGAGDRQIAGLRTSRSATVRNNYVSVPGGIAYGAASSEMVVFEGNVAVNTKCGFNFDTFAANRIKIINNQFINCSQGINFTPNYGGNDIIIDNNTFVIGKKFFNTVLGINEDSYAVKASYCQNISANNNYISCPDDPTFKPLDGINGIGNTIIKSNAITIAPPPTVNNTQTVIDLTSTNETLRKQITLKDTQISNLLAQTNINNTQIDQLTKDNNILTKSLVNSSLLLEKEKTSGLLISGKLSTLKINMQNLLNQL